VCLVLWKETPSPSSRHALSSSSGGNALFDDKDGSIQDGENGDGNDDSSALVAVHGDSITSTTSSTAVVAATAAATAPSVEPAIACDQCAFWVHPQCEGFSLEVYHRIALDQEPSLVDGFLCPACRPAKIGSLVQKLEDMDSLYLFAEPVVRVGCTCVRDER